MQRDQEEFNFKWKFRMKNTQSPAYKVTLQEVTFPVADRVLLRHVKTMVHLFPSVCNEPMNGNCCWRSSFALRVEGDHVPPNYIRKFCWHSDCPNKNKSIMHGNNSALGPQQITLLHSEDAVTSLSDTQFQMNGEPNRPTYYFYLASLAVTWLPLSLFPYIHHWWRKRGNRISLSISLWQCKGVMKVG